MRQVTATEKYNAVLEGNMAKKEFVRQMRQKFPMYVSQYNGFDDTVQILKNKQMIFEAAKPAFSGVKVYDDRPALTYSLDALDRAIRIELDVLGLDPASDVIRKDDLDKATSKAKGNLEKDCNHYINLMAGESKKVDKQDKEREVKRGAKDTDVLNGMKKATLKEEVEVQEEEFEMSEDAKKALLGKVVGALRTNYPDITAGILKDFIKTHYQDLLDGADIEDEFREYISVNYEGPSDMGEKKGTDHDGDGDIDSDDYMAAKDKAIKKAMGKDESYAYKRMQHAHDQDRRAGKKSTYDIAKEKQAEKEKQLKEAIKSIIKKTLNEDVINEAATNKLASLQGDFGDYSGASQVINQLENIVTEIEQFHSKTREKIQKIYDGIGNIENEEGLKIGVFIGPAIENAFKQDLRPVSKRGFSSGLELPKAKKLDPEVIAQARAAGEIDETPQEPKATVFTPNF